MVTSALSEATIATLERIRQLAGPLLVAMEHSGMAIVATDAEAGDDPIVFVNPAFTELTGYDLAEALGRNCRFLQGPDTDPEASRRIGDALRGGRTIRQDILNSRKDNSRFWNRLFITPVPDESGRPAFFLSTCRELPGQSPDLALPARPKALGDIEERLRDAAALPGAGAAFEWHIAKARIVGDARFSRIYGLSTKEAAEGIAPDRFFSVLHPEDRTRIRLAVGGMLQGAEVFRRNFGSCCPAAACAGCKRAGSAASIGRTVRPA